MTKLIKAISVVVILITATFMSLAILDNSANAATESSSAGYVNTSYSSLNVRTSASSSSAIISSIAKGSYVTLIAKTGNWWKVEYAPDSYGYVYASFIKEKSGTSTASVKLNWGYLNVRWGPGTNYWVRSRLYNGQTVVVLSSSNGWSNILYNGTLTGYVSSAYLNFNNSINSDNESPPQIVWPVPASSKINQYFSSSSHLGIDIAPSTAGVAGNSVLSVLPGTVVYSGWLGDYGYVIFINSYYNGEYIQTRYAHLESMPFYTVGDTVIAGQTIGGMGSTGNSSGVHLHFEFRIRSNSGTCISNSESTAVNPLNYVSY